MNPKATLALGALLWSTLGCYTYEPVRLGEIPVGADVRARVSADEAERLREVFGREDRLVDGTVVEDGTDGLLLDAPVLSAVQRGGETLSQRLSLPASEILEVELRQLDQVRTGTLLGVAVAGAVYLLVSQLEGGRGTEERPELPPPTEMRLPIRIPIYWPF
jgi:hypothetical protein